MAVFQMPSPPTVNDTIAVPPVEPAYHTLRWPGVYRPEQHDAQPAQPDVWASNPFANSSLPIKRTSTMAALVESPDDEDDDEDDDDYADDSVFFETSEDDSDSTMNDDTPGSDTDSGEGSGDEDETSTIPPATTGQDQDLASITRQLNSGKKYLAQVKKLMSKSSEDLDNLDSDVEAVLASHANDDISPEKAKEYSELKRVGLESLKRKSARIYGVDLNPDFQKALDNAAEECAEARVESTKRHHKSLKQQQTLLYIKWKKTLKDLEIENCQRTIDATEKQIEELRQKAKAIQIIDRVHDLGVEGIKALIATGNESLEYTFNISGIEEDEECTCCD